jgi:hypothetical protein
MSKNMQSADIINSIPVFSPESWSVALNYSGLLGIVPGSFSSVIRSLISDQNKNNGSLSIGTRFMIERLIKSRSLKAALYFGALTFQSDKIANEKYLGEKQLVNLYTPAELAVIVGIYYLFRRTRKLCDPSQFTMITNRFQERADFGGLVGYAIPKISPAVGIITGTMPILGLAPFLFYDRRGFIDYAMHLKREELEFDAKYELKRWSCTSIQIAAVMLQALGLGVPTAMAFAVGLMTDSKKLLNETTDAINYATALNWIRSIELTSNEPDIVHKAEFYPTKQALVTLKEASQTLKENGSQYCWLLRGAYDITPKSTPKLFRAEDINEPGLAQLEDVADEIKQASKMVSEVEEDLKEIFAEDE